MFAGSFLCGRVFVEKVLEMSVMFNENSHALLLGRHLGVVPPGTFNGQDDGGSAVLSGATIWMFDDFVDPLLRSMIQPAPVADTYASAMEIFGDDSLVEDFLGEEKLFLFFEWDFIGRDSLDRFEEIGFVPSVESIIIDEQTGTIVVLPSVVEMGVSVEPSIFTTAEVDAPVLDDMRIKGVEIPVDLAGLFDPTEKISVKDFVLQISNDTSWGAGEFLQVVLNHVGKIAEKKCGCFVHLSLL